jgi:GxxExxY protein
MPYEDEDPPYVEPDEDLDRIARITVDCAFEVHRSLGAGLDEILYESALCRELTLRGLSFQRQLICNVMYKNETIGKKKIDLLIESRLVVEVKAVEAISSLHKAQLLTYLKIMDRKLGLLINFNTAFLKDGIKRVLNPKGH